MKRSSRVHRHTFILLSSTPAHLERTETLLNFGKVSSTLQKHDSLNERLCLFGRGFFVIKQIPSNQPLIKAIMKNTITKISCHCPAKKSIFFSEYS